MDTTYSARQREVVNLITDTPSISIREMARQMGLGATTVQYYVDQLTYQKRIYRGPCKCCGSTVWKVVVK